MRGGLMPGTRSVFDRVVEQHDELRDIIQQLKRFLEPPRPKIGETGYHTWASALAENLTHLHDKLFRHFREEERSGFLDELERQNPSAVRAVETLRRDHDRLLADIRAVLGSALIYAEGKIPENPALRRWTLSILDQLLEHEHEETELLQRVLYEELGHAD
jgi:hypothetical protein